MIPGKVIRNWRVLHGYTLLDLAQMLNVSKTTVQKWESDVYHPSGENEKALRRLMFPGKEAKRRNENAEL